MSRLQLLQLIFLQSENDARFLNCQEYELFLAIGSALVLQLAPTT